MLLLIRLAGKTCGNDTKNVEIMIPLNYLNNFWKTLGIPLIYCEINRDLNWSKNCIFAVADAAYQVMN